MFYDLGMFYRRVLVYLITENQNSNLHYVATKCLRIMSAVLQTPPHIMALFADMFCPNNHELLFCKIS